MLFCASNDLQCEKIHYEYLGVHNDAHSSTTTPSKINHFTTKYRLYMSISIEQVCEDNEDGHCMSVIKGEVCEN